MPPFQSGKSNTTRPFNSDSFDHIHANASHFVAVDTTSFKDLHCPSQFDGLSIPSAQFTRIDRKYFVDPQIQEMNK